MVDGLTFEENEEFYEKWNNDDYMMFQILLLQIGAMKPARNITSSPWKLKIYNIFSALALLFLLVSVCGQVYSLLLVWGNLMKVTIVAFEVAATFNNSCVFLYITSNRKSLQNVMDKMNLNFKEYIMKFSLRKEQSDILRKANKENRVVCWIYTVVNISTIILWTTFPLLFWLLSEDDEQTDGDITDDKNNPQINWNYYCYTIWIPPGGTKSPIYQLVWVFQAIVVYIILMDTAAYVSTYNSLVIYAETQFKVLNSLLARLDQYIIIPQKNETSRQLSERFDTFNDNISEEEKCPLREIKKAHCDERTKSSEGQNTFRGVNNHALSSGTENAAEEFLINCIKYHQALLEFCKEMHQVVSPIIFIYFSCNMVMMCLSIFQSSMGMKENGKVKFISATFSVWVPMYVICWYGERLTEQANIVNDRIYECKWYRASTRMKRDLYFAIMRSQKPVELIAGRTFHLSLEGLANLANTAYAFYTVLKDAQKQ